MSLGGVSTITFFIPLKKINENRYIRVTKLTKNMYNNFLL